MNIFVDIDETICDTPTDRNYRNSTPIKDNINKVNKLYDEGHRIVYWTARGTMTGIDWREVTEKQFSEWDVKHHELRFGKPAYDILVCDKTDRIENI